VLSISGFLNTLPSVNVLSNGVILFFMSQISAARQFIPNKEADKRRTVPGQKPDKGVIPFR
jgi:hypothetical protein